MQTESTPKDIKAYIANDRQIEFAGYLAAIKPKPEKNMADMTDEDFKNRDTHILVFLGANEKKELPICLDEKTYLWFVEQITERFILFPGEKLIIIK